MNKTFKNEKHLWTKAAKDGMVIAPFTFDNSLKAAKEKSYNETGQALNLRKGMSIAASEIASLPGTEKEAMTIE